MANMTSWRWILRVFEMSAAETIEHPEIAKLLGISVNTIYKVLQCKATNAPASVGKKGRQLTYDRDAVLAWIETKPLDRMIWPQTTGPEKKPKFDNNAARDFLFGGLKRRSAGKSIKATTQKVEIRGGAYDMGGDLRSARHQRQAQ